MKHRRLILLLSVLGSAGFSAPLQLKSGVVDPAALKIASDDSSSIRLVQFSKKPGPQERAQLEAAGVEVLRYLPETAYIGSASREAWTAFLGSQSRTIKWHGAVAPEWKISPRLAGWSGEQKVLIRAWDESSFQAELTVAQARQLANMEFVEWIEPAYQITRRNDVSRAVIQSGTVNLTPVYDQGLRGEGQIIGHLDGDIQVDSCFFPGNKVLEHFDGFHPDDASGTEHGTHTAGTLAGRNPESLLGAGVAYMAQIVHGYDLDIGQPLTLFQKLLRAQNSGAFVHSNSWGDDSTANYTSLCVDIDRFAHENEDSLVIFAVSNGPVIKSPENAKNALAVAATTRLSAGQSSDSLNHLSGGAGPTNDGRRKPEILATGFTNSANYQDPCGLIGFGGTSMATPAVAGAAALARQYFMEGFYPQGVRQQENAFTPSGSLLKAVLLLGGNDLLSEPGYPANLEGYGWLRLDDSLFFQGDRRDLRVFESRNSEGFQNFEPREYDIRLESSTEPLVLVLTWADPEASLLANPAIVNDLDLEIVDPDGTLYRGNVLLNGSSVSGGEADSMNTVEIVRIPSPAAGSWTARIRPSALPMAPQGFALAIAADITGGRIGWIIR